MQEVKRSKSVLMKRRNWNTSARRKNDDDSPIDLKKSEFGDEYRKVLDKLLEPKLPDNREFEGDPAYEYAKKAKKLRIVRKVDLIKNTGFNKFLQRTNKTSFIRNMICISNERAHRRFSILEADYKLGIK